MRLSTLYRRSLAFHWRTHLATILAVAAAATVLTGALVVGDSMRGSLYTIAVGRLGRIEHALTGPRFFRESLAAEIADPLPVTHGPDGSDQAAGGSLSCPIILIQGGIRHAASGEYVHRIQILGIDERFWFLGTRSALTARPVLTGRSVILNEPLARQLNVSRGDDVLLRFERPGLMPAETLLGRRDDRSLALRLKVVAIIPPNDLGGFSLTPIQADPLNAYIPLATLQQALKQPGRVNTILVAGLPDRPPSASDQTIVLDRRLSRHATLADFGLKCRRCDELGYVALESESSLIEPAVETAATQVVAAMGVRATGVLTYLANTIALDPADAGRSSPSSLPAGTHPAAREIPYSIVTAVDVSPQAAILPMTLVDGQAAPPLGEREIMLNEWAASDLGAEPGDRIVMSYYTLGSFGQLDTESEVFTLRGVVRIQGWAADRLLAPEYRGMTDAKHLSDWEPPFPIDLSRIRRKDEDYWARYGPTPKAFVSLATGQSLWAGNETRFGRLTSIRITPASLVRESFLAPAHAGIPSRPPAQADSAQLSPSTLASLATEFEHRLLLRLTPGSMGLLFDPVRSQAASAARGNTDFGMLFMGFSGFLIVAAAMLAALMFRLAVDRRSSEVGVLTATGFPPRTVMRLLLAEGAFLAGTGATIGSAAAVGYAWLMLAALRAWWPIVAGVPQLELHVQTASWLTGLATSMAVSLLAMAWAVRHVSRASPRPLLAGVVASELETHSVRHQRAAAGIAIGSFLAAAVLMAISAGSDMLPQAPAFFGSGAALLIACLAAFARWTARPAPRRPVVPGPWAITHLGLRNAGRNPRRSLLTFGLIASATFIIVAVGANRQQTHATMTDKHSGTGGFSLLAESTVPILYDLNTPIGRKALNLSTRSLAQLSQCVVIPFRVHGGDDASCLNLYQARSPRILGACDAMIDRGGFRFLLSRAQTTQETRNPWLLLNKPLPDGAIPAIGDDNTVTWSLHRGLGQDMIVPDERGNPVRLRIVAVLTGSILQGELVIAEHRFTALFPSVNGYNFFLLDVPPALAESLQRDLEADLADDAFDASPAIDRLNAYLAVENTYLATFQTLGGLGIVLGTFGLAAVLLRHVLERRGELALLQALGYRRSVLAWMVLAENVGLLIAGLLAGTLSALLTVVPHLASRSGAVPWLPLGLNLLATLAIGTLASLAVLLGTLRAPLLKTLRGE